MSTYLIKARNHTLDAGLIEVNDENYGMVYGIVVSFIIKRIYY